jgi:FtsH-binding integral membrane protein
MKKIKIGIWIYCVLCLVLVLAYRYYTEMFEPNVSGLNLSLWYALIINLVLLGFSVVSFKESKLLSILGIILVPFSTYSFYRSWTDFKYDYLAGFLAIPIILLVLGTIKEETLKRQSLVKPLGKVE